MDRVIYSLVVAVLWVVQKLPPRLVDRLGGFAGWLAWLLLPGYRALVQRNLRQAFGRERDARQIRRMARRHFSQLGANLLGAAHFFAADEAKVRRHTRMENLEILRAAHARGRGVVLAISHIGNWEMFAQACFYARELPFGTVFQKVHNRHLDGMITRFRQRLGVKTFDRRAGLSAAAAFLRSGGVLGVLVDQHAGESGIWMPFFGKLASTSPLAASLAVKTGAAVVPVAVFRTGPAHWRIAVRPEVTFDEVPSAEQVPALTASIARVLESQITESPLDWFWVHNRWKLPKPEFLLTRAKRGIYLPSGVTARQLTPLRVVVRSSNWLGDAVMNVPAVQAVKKGRPDVHLTVLAPAKLADVWREVPEVDEVLVIGPRESIFSVAGRLRRGRFDAAIILPNSLRTALEVFLAGVPRRAGFAGHRRRWLLNQVAKGRKKRRSQPHTLRPEHHAKNYLRLVQEFGAGEPPVWPDSRSLAPSNQPPVLGLCPGAEYGPAKRWPVEKYRAVMEKISAATDAEWRIFGVAKDRPLAAILCENFPGRVVDRTGQTTLRELLEELREVRLLVTNDTGTMHLAALLGTPTVAIFGSTEPSLTGPLGEGHVVLRHQVECSPCFLRECPLDFRCMEGVTVDAVVEAIRRLV